MKHKYGSQFKYQSPKKPLLQGFKPKQISNKERIQLIEYEDNLHKYIKALDWADRLQNDTEKYSNLYNSEFYKTWAAAKDIDIDQDRFIDYRANKQKVAYKLPSSIRRDKFDDDLKNIKYKFENFIAAGDIVMSVINDENSDYTWLKDRAPIASEKYQDLIQNKWLANKVLDTIKTAVQKEAYEPAYKVLTAYDWNTINQIYEDMAYLTTLTTFSKEKKEYYDKLQEANEVEIFKVMAPLIEEEFLSSKELEVVAPEDVIAKYWNYIQRIQELFSLNSDSAVEFAREYGYTDLDNKELYDKAEKAANAFKTKGVGRKYMKSSEPIRRKKKPDVLQEQMRLSPDTKLSEIARYLGISESYYKENYNKYQSMLNKIRGNIDFDTPTSDIIEVLGLIGEFVGPTALLSNYNVYKNIKGTPMAENNPLVTIFEKEINSDSIDYWKYQLNEKYATSRVTLN